MNSQLTTQQAPRLLVPIVNRSVVLANTAYPLRNISSVNLSREKGNTAIPSLLFLAGGFSLVLLISVIPLRAENKGLGESIAFFAIPILISLAVIVYSRVLRRRVKDWYIVQIATNAREGSYFKTKDADSAQFTAAEIVRQTNL